MAGFALLAGLYALAVPPFESPDENSHFEYAWLLGRLGRAPQPGDRSPELHAAVARYMTERGYGLRLPQPGGGTALGFNLELGRQPPAYYALPALVGLVAPDDLELQVRLMRLPSVLLGALVVLVAALVGRLAFRDDLFARLGLPAVVALTPGFAFIAGSINNDNLASLGGAVAVLGLVRLLGRVDPASLALIALGAALGLLGKRTALAAIPATGLCAYLLLVARAPGPAVARLSLAVLPFALLASWPLWAVDESTRAVGWRVEPPFEASRVPVGLLGGGALRAASTAAGSGRLSQLLSTGEAEGAVEGFTAAAWARSADGVEGTAALEVRQGERAASVSAQLDASWRPLRLTFQPRVGAGPVALALVVPPGAPPALFDVVVAAPGQRRGLPEAEDDAARRGRWDGAPFTNMLANGSGEEAADRLTGWLAAAIEAVGGSADVAVATLRVERLSGRPAGLVPQRLDFAFGSYVGRFGWQVLPMPPAAYEAVRLVGLAAGLGLLWLLLRCLWRPDPAARRRLALAGVFGLVVVGALGVAVLPFLIGAMGAEWPQGRYLYPAIVPISGLLVLGLAQLVPSSAGRPALGLLLAGGLLLHAAALLGTILPRYAAGA